MKTMTITIDRRPQTFTIDGKDVQVEELSLRLPFARKPENLRDMIATGNYIIYVTETREMTHDEYDGFTCNLLASRDWLKGKGGSLGQGRLCVEIHAPGRPYLYVDPSGTDSVRYLAKLG